MAFRWEGFVASLVVGAIAVWVTVVTGGDQPLHRASAGGNVLGVYASLLVGRGTPEPADLFASIEGNHYYTSQALLMWGAPVNARDEHGDTPLHVAAAEAGPALTDLLLSYGADKDARGTGEALPLHVAAVVGNVASLTHMLANNMYTVDAEAEGRTSLHLAAMGAHVEAVRVLLESGASLKSNGVSSGLLEGVMGNDTIVVKLLIDRGADVNEGVQGGYPMSYACYVCNSEIFDMLVQAGAAVDSESSFGETPLVFAVDGNCTSLAQQLLALKPELAHFPDNGGELPLHHAVKSRNIELVSVLLSSAADEALATRSQEGLSPMEVALDQKFLEGLKLMVARGGDPNTKTASGVPLLSWAAELDDVALIKFLVDHGGDPNQLALEGLGTLHFAAQSGKTRICALLLGLGAAVDLRTPWGATPLHAASENGHEEVVKLLLRNGADPDAAYGETQWTALHLSCYVGHFTVIQALIEGGADVNAETMDGFTPLSLAEEFEEENYKKQLLKTSLEDGLLDSPKDQRISLLLRQRGGYARPNIASEIGLPQLCDLIDGAYVFTGHIQIPAMVSERTGEANVRSGYLLHITPPKAWDCTGETLRLNCTHRAYNVEGECTVEFRQFPASDCYPEEEDRCGEMGVTIQDTSMRLEGIVDLVRTRLYGWAKVYVTTVVDGDMIEGGMGTFSLLQA